MMRPSFRKVLFLLPVLLASLGWHRLVDAADRTPSPLFGPPPQSMTFGALLELTGDGRSIGTALKEGMDLALDTFEDRRGELPVRVSLEAEDTADGDVERAVQLLRDQDKATPIFTQTADEALEALPLLREQKLPLLAVADVASTDDGRLFSVGVSGDASARLAARFAYSTLKARIAIILKDGSRWSGTRAKMFEDELRHLGGTVPRTIDISESDDDIDTIVASLARAAPDVVFVPLRSHLVDVYTARRRSRLSIPFISSGRITSAQIDEAPASFEGMVQTSPALPSTKALQRLSEMYETKFGRNVELPAFVALGFDAMDMTLVALQHAHGDIAKLTSELEALGKFDGMLGERSFSGGHSAPHSAAIFKISSGGPVPVPFDPAADRK